MERLAAVLPQCSSLAHIVLDFNRIGAEGAARLEVVLLQCPSLAHIGLRSVSHNGASVAPSAKETKGSSANLRISAHFSDFSNNPEDPVEGDTKDMMVALYLGGAVLGVLALAYFLPRWKGHGQL